MTTKTKTVLEKDSGEDVNPGTFEELFSTATPYDYFLMSMGTLGAMITGASLPFVNILFGRIMDALNKNPDSFESLISPLCISLVVIAAINVVSGFLQVTCWSIAGERQTQKIREKYVTAILAQEIGWFDTCGAAELATIVEELTTKVQDGMGRKAGDMIQYCTQVLASFCVGFYLEWKLTLVLLCAFPMIAGAGAFMIMSITAANNQSLVQYAAAGGLATESLGAVRTVTALNAQPDVISRYRKFLFDTMQVGIDKGLRVGMGHGSIFCVIFFTYALGFWYGGKLVADSLAANCKLHDNCITGGQIISVFFSMLMGAMALGQIAPPLTAIVSAKACIAPMMEVINRKPLIDGFSDEGLKPDVGMHASRGRIEFQVVKFAYPSRPDHLICKGYDLAIEQGESVAIVGPSGCGKSTVINLLLRFYDPNGGTVTLDGFDIRTLNVRWLRAQIGYVGQEPVLYAGSILENIAYGLDPTVVPEAKLLMDAVTPEQKRAARDGIKDKIIEAAKMANAHDFIMQFPQGYDTDVGSNGGAMSGGQKQRIAIARALVKKPVVLLLDEATSALDATSERLVQESIDKLQQSKMQTTIIIAHRLSTIQNADKIAVIKDGLIEELGKHAELIERNGIYADLVRLQMTGQDDTEEQDIAAEEELIGNRKKTASDVDATITSARNRNNSVGSVESRKTKEGLELDKLTPEELESRKQKGKLQYSRTWQYIFAYPLWFFAALLGGALFGAVFPVWGMILARSQTIFYLTVPNDIRTQISEMAGVFCLLAVVSLVSSVLQYWSIAQVGERVSMRLRSEMFEAFLRREIGFFDLEENAIGSITTRLATDSNVVNKATGETLAKQVQALFTLAIGLGIGLSASWKVGLVVLATFPLSIAAAIVRMKSMQGQQYDTENGEGGAGHGGLISTAFTHMRTVSAFSVQFKVAEEYATLTRVICEDRSRRAVIGGLGFGGANTSTFLTYALLFWYGSQLIKAGDIDFEQMLTAMLSLMLGALGLGQAIGDLGDQTEGIEAATRIFNLVDAGKNAPIDGLSMTGIRPETRSQGRIELKNVRFAYPTRPDVMVCKNYNLVIEPGEVVALVGPSGSGKSTIMNLLLRFYDPLEGEVLLDGHDVRTLNVRWLRAQIGYVGQEPVLFQGSVASNIAKGRAEFGDSALLSLEEAMRQREVEMKQGGPAASAPGVSSHYEAVSVATEGDVELGLKPGSAGSHGKTEIDEDIIRAAKESNAHDFVSSFPDGYNTDVGEGSIMVSGGQKQRIAIARALVKRPAVLLLDEATSALDAASEKLVQESIDMLQQSKMQTTIVIAHRLTTIRNADKIAVIDKGAVVEMGKHDELLAMNGLYAQLWNKQKGSSTDRGSIDEDQSE